MQAVTGMVRTEGNDENESQLTYTVQVERVGASGGAARAREADLDRRVKRELVDAAARQEALRRLGAAQDLEQDRDRGRNEGGVVDEKVRPVEAEVHRDGLVDTAWDRLAGLDRAPSYYCSMNSV